jgi:hypothetical protein
VSDEVSCTVARDVVCPVKCLVLWLGTLCVRCSVVLWSSGCLFPVSVVYCGLGRCVSDEVSCTVAWDVVCPVKCLVLWLGTLCVR